MRKRERENPCGVCGHYHKCEEGEICGVCGHRPAAADAVAPARVDSAFPSEVLKGFLFLGSYDNASRSEVLKTLNITHILNVRNVPRPFSRAPFLLSFDRLRAVRSEKCGGVDPRCSFARHSFLWGFAPGFGDSNWLYVFVFFTPYKYVFHHQPFIMLAGNMERSAAVVTAFLMKSRGWRLAPSLQWVKDRRPQVQITEASQCQLVEYEQKLFGPSAGSPAQTTVLTESFPSLGFGFPQPSGDIQVPAFNQTPVPSIFERAGPNNVPSNFTFGAEGSMGVGVGPAAGISNGAVTPASTDNQMDSS
ncbi:Protein-tyrosine-phosphatase IBR5 [Triticum urartu]|uniref:Protein-tyrosine-phosphatase IBR5 n=1 Tax=Triticum urartu TaxID=4572 RepID=M7ZC63_TRIUA|nr:Protein-tyrosine-phosphatase IBR5 [Triticum urartu]